MYSLTDRGGFSVGLKSSVSCLKTYPNIVTLLFTINHHVIFAHQKTQNLFTFLGFKTCQKWEWCHDRVERPFTLGHVTAACALGAVVSIVDVHLYKLKNLIISNVINITMAWKLSVWCQDCIMLSLCICVLCTVYRVYVLKCWNVDEMS